MRNTRLNIGLYVSNLVDVSVYSVCKGAAAAAEDINANLIIFPGMHLNGDYNDPLKSPYYYQYNTIYELGGKEKLDFLLIMTGIIGNTLEESEIKKFINKFSDIPILTISSEYPEYSSIRFDNQTGLRKAINHLIHKHNCRRLAFVSGSKFNTDAIERLEVYRNTLLENNLPIDHNLIVYGDFSEYSDDVVRDLIKNNPDIDAICFANDEMAKGGYRVLKNSEYIIGKNISVIGFDNSSTAYSIYPMLTTVNADNFELGYDSVKHVPELIESKKTEHYVIPTNMVIRNSCGCKNTSYEKLSYIFSDTKLSKRQLSSYSINDYMDYLFSDKEMLKYSHVFEKEKMNSIQILFCNFFEILLDYNEFISHKQYRKSVQNAVTDIISTGILRVMPIDKLFNIIDAVYCKLASPETDDDDLGYVFAQIYREFSAYTKTSDNAELKAVQLNDAFINYIVNDVIITGESNDQALRPIMKRLSALGIDRSFMFLFETPAMHKENSDFIPPANAYLKFSQDHDNIIYWGSKALVSAEETITCSYVMNTDSPVSLVVSPLFSNEEIYGLLVCEMKPELYQYINKIALQISTALKYNSLLNNWQTLLANEIENSRNFENISKHDELTGLYNRRGYFDNASAIIHDPVNEGKSAIAVFADMDNLKVINDKFGHDDGDYALKSIAEILSRSFRTTDIIGRIGGDEFAVFALVGCSENINQISNRIAETAEKFNESCTKPYFVNMSVGISPFICSKDIVLNDILEKADELLYNQKKNKKKVVLKNTE
ncbi:MAG: diguanylate cyclase [Oscillospiraceae bacterium]|nr:diguanylate cyclase [Oscillospiraceae bacterium]